MDGWINGLILVLLVCYIDGWGRYDMRKGGTVCFADGDEWVEGISKSLIRTRDGYTRY